MDVPPGRGLYLFFQRNGDRTELDVPWGTLWSEPLARLQAHVGIYSQFFFIPLASPITLEILTRLL